VSHILCGMGCCVVGRVPVGQAGRELPQVQSSHKSVVSVMIN
jgi:hypothetical protein